MKRKTLVIVGAGPSCTYVLDRIAAYASQSAADFSLRIFIFDRCGEFGAGQVHSPRQPKSSFLNRIAGQVSFAADETIEGAGPLMPADGRLVLHEWCQREYEKSGDKDFDLKSQDWPKRYIHGLALRAHFKKSCEILEKLPTIDLQIHQVSVVDVKESGTQFEVFVDDPALGPFLADNILFLTGHSANMPSRRKSTRELDLFAKEHKVPYVASAYPLENTLTNLGIGPDTVVGIAGMGLTALDVILFLTEEQGGIFERRENGEVVYRPSGREPKRIIPFSESGLFTFARPFNAKEVNLEELEHKGVFFTDEAVQRIRESSGTAIDLGHLGTRLQLDFEAHVFPLVVLEMAFLYYRTLLGEPFSKYAQKRVLPAFENFLLGKNTLASEGIASLLQPLESAVDEVSAVVDAVLQGEPDAAAKTRCVYEWNLPLTFSRYMQVVFGETAREEVAFALQHHRVAETSLADLSSPFGHQILLRDNRFHWSHQIHPIALQECGSPEKYRAAMIAFMKKDHLWAKQNNLTNPAKSAADGVWRDLRPTLAHAADFGGLTANSHRIFLDVYMRHHNRLANGAALEVMEKMLALIECGLVDISVGPDGAVSPDPCTGKFRVSGGRTHASYQIDCLIDGKVHPFDPEHDVQPLYPNLLRRGLVRKWKNPSGDGQDFEPGGLDLTKDFCPLRRDGALDRRLTFLGPPSEGVMFFQLGALRPNQNHHVMQDILVWLKPFWNDLTAEAFESSLGEKLISPGELLWQGAT